MRKNGLFIWLLTVLLATALLAGCGGKNAAVTEDDVSKEMKISWIVVGDKPKDYDKVIAEVNKYLKEKINATLDISFYSWGDYEKKMIAITTAGDNYDICFTCHWMFDYRRGARQGMFYPLDELLPLYGEGIMKSLDIMPKMLEGTKINGHIYGVPVRHDPYQTGYFINRSIVDKYNFDFSKVHRLEDMFPLYDKIKADNPRMVCVGDLSQYCADDVFDWMINAGVPGAVRVDDKDCKVINQFEDPDFVAVLKARREAQLRGYTYKDAVNVNRDQDYKSGKLAIYLNTYASGVELGLNASGTLPPTKVIPLYRRATVDTRNVAMGAMLAVNSQSKNPARVMKFINMLYSDAKLYNMLNYGLQGVHYKMTGENQIELLAAGKDYIPMPSWMYGNSALLYVPAKEAAARKALEEEAKKVEVVWSPIFGFTPDLESMQTELSAMGNIASQYETELQYGTRDVEPLLREFNAKMRAAGMDKFIAEMQKQIDNWKKTNTSK